MEVYDSYTIVTRHQVQIDAALCQGHGINRSLYPASECHINICKILMVSFQDELSIV